MRLDLDKREAFMTLREFDGLLNYSASLPTGQTPGKVWKREWIDEEGFSNWSLGQYDPAGPKGEQITIFWYDIFIDGAHTHEANEGNTLRADSVEVRP